MIQIAFLIFAGLLVFHGIKALAGKEDPPKKTSTTVAIITIGFGIALAGFAIFGLPMMLNF